MDSSEKFENFDYKGKSTWINLLKSELGDDSWETLKWQTGENITLNPFYTREDLTFPVISDTIGHLSNRHWVNYQSIKVIDFKESNEKGIHALHTGADGIIFDLTAIEEPLDLHMLIGNINPTFCHLSFKLKPHRISQLNLYFQFLEKKGFEPEKINGFCQLDIQESLSSNTFHSEEYFDQLKELLQTSAAYAGFYPIELNGRYFRECGSKITDELGFSIGLLVEQIEALDKRAINPRETIMNTVFTLGIGSNYFMEIAKFRAFRYLVCQIINAYEIKDVQSASIHIHGANLLYNKSILDPDTNMIRNTTESLSAVIGGCDSMEILPHDILSKKSKEGAIISRNISNILKEESHLNKVSDPAAGSYFIEHLTYELIKNSWQLFLEIEEHDGFSKSLADNLIHKILNRSKEENDSEYLKGMTKMVGVNKYLLKNPYNNIQWKNVALKSKNQNNHLHDFHAYRIAEKTENSRYRTIKIAREYYGGINPQVLLLSLSQETQPKKMLQYFSELFESHGFDIKIEDEISGLNPIPSSTDSAKILAVILIIAEPNTQLDSNKIVPLLEAVSKPYLIYSTQKISNTSNKLPVKGVIKPFSNNFDIIADVQEFMENYHLQGSKPS